jgi:gliding motility-associated-like protein
MPLKNPVVATLLMLLLFAGTAKATHIVGGEIRYECLGNDEYRISLQVYRDCGPTNTNNTQFDMNAPLAIYTSSGTLVGVEMIQYPGSITVPVVISNPCLTSPPSICIEGALYVTTVTLPPIGGGYDLVYQRCCRNPSTINIVQPGSFGATYTTHIPGPADAVCNNSAYFSNYPPLVLCSGEDFEFDHSATDVDGDSLVYALATPYTGGNQQNPAPNPPTAPPFAYVNWAAGYSANAPLGANPALTIDSQTGVMACTPSALGIFVYAVCAKEYRNGVLINESCRDFQVTVTNCVVNTAAIIDEQTSVGAGNGATFCSGLTQTFTNSSISTSSYFWDFGDLSTLADTSSLASPSYTFLDTGVYIVSLISNPGWACADTITAAFSLYPSVEPEFPPVPGQCAEGNEFFLEAQGQFGGNATFIWDFGPNATPTTSNLMNPSVSFSDTGHYAVTLHVSENGCDGTYSGEVIVFPVPEVGFNIPSFEGCAEYQVQFIDGSVAWGDLNYFWDFGDGNSSTEANPLHSYPFPGDYTVQLTIESDTGCIHIAQTDPATIKVFPSPTAGFSVDVYENSIYTPWINVYDESFGDTAMIYYFGDGFTTTEPFYEHSYLDTGWHTISQTVTNEFGCKDSTTEVIRIRPEFLFFAPNAFTPNGDGLNEIWQPHVGGADQYEILIFNRFGSVIWNSSDPEQGWDGVPADGSKLSQVAVYPYIAILRDMNTKVIHKYHGHITIVR